VPPFGEDDVTVSIAFIEDKDIKELEVLTLPLFTDIE
jgi:hypothetical protein